MSIFRQLSVNSVVALGALMLISSAHAAEPLNLDIGEMVEQVPEGLDLVPELTAEEQDELSRFVEPTEAEVEQFSLLGRAGNIDPNGVIPRQLLERALAFFDKNQSNIKNKSYLTVVNFSKHSSYGRMYIINMRTGGVTKLHVAHGKGSDPKNTGFAQKFSNTVGSNATSLGYYRTAEVYRGTHGRSLRLDGISSTNSNARKRAVVVHGADYVSDSDKKAGRSNGCLAVSMPVHDTVVSLLKEGSIIYAGAVD